MTHEEATTTGAAERYLLNEMAAEERTQFEEHFFSCRECGEDMYNAGLLIESIRNSRSEIGARERLARILKYFFSPFSLPSSLPTLAAGILGVVVWYQSMVVIPRVRQGTEARQASVYLLRPETRGEVPKVATKRDHIVILSLDLPGTPNGGRVEAVIRDESGHQVAGTAVRLNREDSRASLMLPSDLPPARYTIVLHSAQAELASYQFDLQSPDAEGGR